MVDKSKRDPNRKSTRHFELEKTGSHHFDLEKNTASRFDMAKAIEDVAVPVATDSTARTQTQEVVSSPPVGVSGSDAVHSQNSDKGKGPVTPPQQHPSVSSKSREVPVLHKEKPEKQGKKNPKLSNTQTTVKRDKNAGNGDPAMQQKVASQGTSSTTTTTTPQVSQTEPKSNGKKWLAAIVFLAVLAGGGYYLSHQGGGDNTPVSETVDKQKPNNMSSAETENSSETVQDEQTQEVVSSSDAPNEVSSTSLPVDAASKTSSTSSSTNSSTVAASSVEKTEEQKKGGVNRNTAAASSTSSAKSSETTKRQNTSTLNNIQTKQRANSTVATVSGTVEEVAKAVIRGDYGNGAERKRLLGERYAEIQRLVNEMYKKGLVN